MEVHLCSAHMRHSLCIYLVQSIVNALLSSTRCWGNGRVGSHTRVTSARELVRLARMVVEIRKREMRWEGARSVAAGATALREFASD